MKNKIEFLFMFILVTLNAYLLGGVVSGTLLIVFISIFITSIIFTRITKRNIDVHVILPKEDIMKEDFLEVKVEIKNKSILPTSIIEIDFIKDDIFTFDDSNVFRFTLESRKSKVITMKYYQLFRGKGTIGIDDIKIGDYFGISSIYIDGFDNKKEITVLPVIFPIDINSDIVKKLTSSMRLVSSDYYINFSNIEIEPGYEFRQYVPGDSLNRINWKKFSKNRELLVRKNDNIIAINKKAIIMNPYIAIEKKDRRMIENKILKTVLSLAFVLLDRNIDVEIYIFENDLWTIYEIREMEDINIIQNKFVEYQFIHRFDEGDIKKSLEKLVVEIDSISITANIDAFIENIDYIFKLSEVENEVVWVKNSNDQLNYDVTLERNLWVLKEDYQFYNLF
ncbi:Hypothetical protein CM240_2347 [Clostridium bornimense]|uniref:Uncharacterized protein n=1 Tax=Clostridium bornimense TaxID=1216932 RepID=W6S0V6_9CLOT|nr:DUF58 domain-containing protein [Clostridium bornimense]CDM69484.1 Hypothetical protein CM240_2347 [Clostridium bornimense]